MIFSYNWLQSFFNPSSAPASARLRRATAGKKASEGKGKLPKPDKLTELLTMHAFEVEGVEKRGKDWVLDVDILPNRGHDCLCHIGIAEEIAAILNLKLKEPLSEKLKKVKGKIQPIQVKIQCPRLVPRYSAIVIEGVKITKSPEWLKEKLKAVGIRSINNIIDLTNFVMLEMGQPLHAFDYDKISGQKMIIRQSKKGEELITLDGAKRELEDGVLVIEDKNRLIDLVGIMGGKLSEIDSKTKNIVLQAGNFDRRSIYLACKKLKHSTEASNIYAQGIDPNLTTTALERIYFLLKQLAGGQIVQIIDIYPKKVLPKKITLDLNYVEKLLGVKIPVKEIKNILISLGFGIEKSNTSILGSIEVKIPTWRLDIDLPEDLIEEIGRIHGYEKIPAVSPKASLIPPERNLELFWQEAIRNNLKELGFSEVYNYSFISQKDKVTFGLRDELVELQNPISSEFQYLRPTLLINLLKNVSQNKKFFNEFSLFEVGNIFTNKGGLVPRPARRSLGEGGSSPQASEGGEKTMLSGVIFRKDDKQGFYELKGVCDGLFAALGISDAWYDEYKPTPPACSGYAAGIAGREQSKSSIWQKGRCAEIKVGQKEIGFLGGISPKILAKEGIGDRGVVMFDFDLEKLIKCASEEHEYQPISKYPAAVRDVAVLVPLNAKVVEVLNVINVAGGKLVRDVDLFDMYEGEELPSGKKNLAFHIVFQSEEKTMKAEEIDKLMAKIMKALEENAQWEVRK